MDYIWIAIAFVFGFVAKQAKLPPLVGYLAAGFSLHALGVTPDSSLETLSNLGITLLLFTVGLKLNVSSLVKTEIWAGAMGHMLAFIALTSASCFLFAFLGLQYFSDLDISSALLIGFAASFSSTVCAIRVLEQRGEMSSRHGQVSIGILIFQDIAAVLFVTFSTGKMPGIWALALLALPLLRPLLNKLITLCGHGELLTLAGFFLAISGGELFEAVGLKAHLGALIIGILLSDHNKATELTKSLLSFKDIFLIAFFLSIGFTAVPTVDMLSAALIMLIALPIKTAMFMLWLTRLKLRGRTSLLASLSLANYSEFGLIVCSISVDQGLLEKEWLVIMALAVALSFAVSSIINLYAHNIYRRYRGVINKLEHPQRIPEDRFADPEDAAILVVGMGRVGTGAYDTLQEHHQKKICGMDVDRQRIARHQSEGRNAIVADAEDPDFWENTQLENVELIMLAIPNHQDIIEVVKQLRYIGFKGKTAGIAKYDDEKDSLLETGIDVVFNFYSKAGAGFAEESLHLIE